MPLHGSTNLNPQTACRASDAPCAQDRDGSEAPLRLDNLLGAFAVDAFCAGGRMLAEMRRLAAAPALVERLARPQQDLESATPKEVEPAELSLLVRILSHEARRKVQRDVLIGSAIEDIPYIEGIEAGVRLMTALESRPYLSAVFDETPVLRHWRADFEDLLILYVDGRISVPTMPHMVIALTAAHAAIDEGRRLLGSRLREGILTEEDLLAELTGVAAEAIAGGPLSADRARFAQARLDVLRAAACLARQPEHDILFVPGPVLFPEPLDRLTDEDMRSYIDEAVPYIREVERLRREAARHRAEVIAGLTKSASQADADD